MRWLSFIILLVTQPLLAHDMWLELQKDGPFTIHQGEKLVAMEDSPPLLGDRVSRWEIAGGVAAMERRASYVKLDAEEFNHYLEEEEHTHIEKLSEGSVIERFTRHLKTIVDSTADPSHLFGLRLEIVPLSRPAVGALAVKILLEGKPLENARVELVRRGDRKTTVARTNARGEATLTLTSRGFYLVRAIHLRPCDCDDADFESQWAALTFNVK